MKQYLSTISSIQRPFFWLCMLICVFSTLFVGGATAQQNDPIVENEKKPADDVEKGKDWLPAPPPSDEFDWIQLTSGEWLKGQLKILYDDELEFDSDELGLLVLDWEDVKQIRGYQVFALRFEGPITLVGLMQMIDDKVYITTDEGVQDFARKQLIAIAPGIPKERNYWAAKISLGLNIVKGNTDQIQNNAKLNVKRRTSATRIVVDYLGNYSITDDVETVRNQRINGYWDIFKTRKYYLRPIFGEYYSDPFQNIAHRSTLGTGIGSHIIDTSKISFDITVGVAYQYTNFESVEPTMDSSASTPALVAGTDFDLELTKKIDFIVNYQFSLIDEESGLYIHHAMATFATEITDILDFDVSMVWDRIQKPTARADGSTPQKDDFQLILWVGVDF